MADRAIRAVGSGDAPLSYKVPGATAIRIKMVHVKYVDNGAAGDWLPAIQIVDDSSHTMGTAADQNVSTPAGQDADVTFFPGVKSASSAAASDANNAFAYLASIGTTAIPGGAVFTPIDLLDGINATLITNTNVDFGNGNAVIGGTLYHGLEILKEGIYAFSVVHFITGGTAGARIDTHMLAYPEAGATTSPGQSAYSEGRQAVLFGDQWDPGVAGAKTFWTEYWDFPATSVPSVMIADATNHGVAAGALNTYIWAQRVTKFNVPIGSWT